MTHPGFRSIPWRAALAALLLAQAAAGAWAVDSFEQVRSEFRPSDVRVLDRQGELLQRVRTDATVRRGQWTALADVSPALRTALVLSEDRRFYEHSGVDWRAVSAAAWANLWNTKTRGASTITMQLAGLLDDDLRRASGGRSVGQKIGQAVTATQLERQWRKDQVLEAYLNLVPFRGELVGIDALSRTLFDKAPHGLDAREAAVAAALVRAPNAKPALVAQRACEVMKSMAAPEQAPERSVGPPQASERPPGGQRGHEVPGAGATSCAALDMFTSAVVQRRAFEASEGIAPHFARQALRAAREADGNAPVPTELRTTLRAPLQRFALQGLQRHLRELRGRNVEDGALVVLDNASGEVLAWVGSSGQLSRAAEVDAVLAPRQPGSTLKPLLYAQAIAERRLTAASLLEDSSAQIATSGGLYIPQNYDRHFKGPVSVRTALAASLNVPAVRTLVMVSPDAFARQLQRAGITLAQSGDYYGYSLALGSAELTLLQLANAFRTLANGGRASGTRMLLPQRPQPVAFAPALDPRAAFIVGDILSDANARTRTFGVDSVLGTRFWTAVKTGTSKDMRDNWAVGWSERYTVGVWIGNASGAPMWDVSGTTGAAPLWAETMRFLHRREPSRAPSPPPGVVQAQVRFGPNPTERNGEPIEAARSEWFIAGTEQPLFAMETIAARARPAGAAGTLDSKDGNPARITAPTQGTILALDPDIPPRHQRVNFESDGAGRDVQWRIDGKPFARGTTAQWLPWPGRHTVELADAQGQVLDTIQLEVRGAGVAAPARRR
ncbi:MAG: transglycosylase domain-containing protein [Pseudomonadota bacterium]|nr:transglycosylase domain-containing protein [Pseudomonadota bacterium]